MIWVLFVWLVCVCECWDWVWKIVDVGDVYGGCVVVCVIFFVGDFDGVLCGWLFVWFVVLDVGCCGMWFVYWWCGDVGLDCVVGVYCVICDFGSDDGCCVWGWCVDCVNGEVLVVG